MSGGRAYGGIHGVWHGPRGSDPSACEQWREVIETGTTAWSDGDDYSPGDIRDHDNFRWEAIRISGPSSDDGAIEPGVDSFWVAYWLCQGSLYINGQNADPSDAIPNPVPLRYRLSVGPPNYLEIDGAISFYTDHQIEIEGDVAGLLMGDTVFMLPPEYQIEFDKPVSAHDDDGNYVPCRILSTGEFIYGAA